MMELLSIPSEKPDASLLVKTINGMGGFETTGKRFLLVIDDLDSLSIPDQKRQLRYTCGILAKGDPVR